MAENTWVNSQITDAVTQTNVKLLGDAPAESIGMLYQMLAQSTGLSMQNLVAAQQHKNSIDSAVTTQGVNLLFTIDTATSGVATNGIFTGNSVAEQMSALKASLAMFKNPPAGPYPS
ncbi:RebB family R body protein [Oceanibacterium hippocampi]|uniref:Killing trait n=1 Tax=Oceanibacterium hippocampi TaxID=745714 RepID=A0A1Y5TDA7_9PROT|nr:RebB family R body protein [Oceanibacterium hippocampi]SLN57783.1 Killing trait [Oceanibacterium hippocampi]